MQKAEGGRGVPEKAQRQWQSQAAMRMLLANAGGVGGVRLQQLLQLLQLLQHWS
jgi:hypothetical protein